MRWPGRACEIALRNESRELASRAERDTGCLEQTNEGPCALCNRSETPGRLTRVSVRAIAYGIHRPIRDYRSNNLKHKPNLQKATNRRFSLSHHSNAIALELVLDLN